MSVLLAGFDGDLAPAAGAGATLMMAASSRVRSCPRRARRPRFPARPCAPHRGDRSHVSAVDARCRPATTRHDLWTGDCREIALAARELSRWKAIRLRASMSERRSPPLSTVPGEAQRRTPPRGCVRAAAGMLSPVALAAGRWRSSATPASACAAYARPERSASASAFGPRARRCERSSPVSADALSGATFPRLRRRARTARSFFRSPSQRATSIVRWFWEDAVRPAVVPQPRVRRRGPRRR
jgi:hypothetical protein